MSLKVHDGYLIRPTTLLELSEFLGPFKERIQGMARLLIARKAAERVCQILDGRTMAPEAMFDLLEERIESAKVRRPLSMVVGDMEERYRRVYGTQQRDPEYDFECWVLIFPTPSWRILARLVTEQKPYREAWEAEEDVTSYWIDTSIDRPENIDPSEWIRRQDDWEITTTRAAVGLRMECLGMYGFMRPTIAEVLAELPTLEQRAHCWALDQVVQRYLERNCGKDARPVELTGAAIRALEWTQEEEGRQALMADRAEAMRLLPPHYTKAELVGER